MTWQRTLLLGTILSVVLVGVGVFLNSSAVRVMSVSEARSAQWSSPFRREVYYVDTSRDVVLRRGDERYWYFAGGALWLVVLTSLPLLHARQERQGSD